MRDAQRFESSRRVSLKSTGVAEVVGRFQRARAILEALGFRVVGDGGGGGAVLRLRGAPSPARISGYRLRPCSRGGFCAGVTRELRLPAAAAILGSRRLLGRR